MKNRVTIIPSDNLIIVDDIYLEIDFYPSKYFHALQWYKGKGEIELGDTIQKISTEEDYNTYILPYVLLWQAEFEKLEAEKKQLEELYNSLPEVKKRKQQEIIDYIKILEQKAQRPIQDIQFYESITNPSVDETVQYQEDKLTFDALLQTKRQNRVLLAKVEIATSKEEVEAIIAFVPTQHFSNLV